LRKPARLCAGLLLILLSHSANCGSIAASTDSAPSPGTKTSSLEEWFSDPPGWVTWLSLAGGLTAFIWKLYEFIVSRVDREKDQRIACDAFWYESIVVPRIVEPLIDFLGQRQEALRILHGTAPADAFTKYKNEYQEKYNDLAARMSLLQVISNSTHSAIMERLNELEDAITVHCYDSSQTGDAKPTRRKSPDMNGRFSDAMNFCITKLKDLHFGLRHLS
jgi:hypothetical protein